MKSTPKDFQKFIKRISNLDKFRVLRFNFEINLNDAHIFVPGQKNEPGQHLYGCFYLDVLCLDQYFAQLLFDVSSLIYDERSKMYDLLAVHG